jgi:hypothetical protein
VIAEPKEGKRDDDCRRNGEKRKPGNLPFVGKPRWSFYFASHQNCNRQSAIGNLKFSKAILLQAPVERASAQAECFCGLTRVTVISGQRFFYQKCLDLFETHLLDVPRFGASSR